MKEIFNLTYKALMFIANLTGFTYNEINIIIWFIIIPFTWCVLIDKILKRNYLKITFLIITVVTLILIKDFNHFCNQLFHQSAEFLRSFNIVGSDYVTSSVLVCLLVPLIVYYFLIKYAYFKKEST
jgi:hypothetical protein